MDDPGFLKFIEEREKAEWFIDVFIALFIAQKAFVCIK